MMFVGSALGLRSFGCGPQALLFSRFLRFSFSEVSCWCIFDICLVYVWWNFQEYWPRVHFVQPKLTQKSYFSATIVHTEIMCIYVQYTDTLFRYKVPEANTHVPHHTQRENDTTNGGLAPIGTIERPFVCKLWFLVKKTFCWRSARSKSNVFWQKPIFLEVRAVKNPYAIHNHIFQV